MLECFTKQAHEGQSFESWLESCRLLSGPPTHKPVVLVIARTLLGLLIVRPQVVKAAEQAIVPCASRLQIPRLVMAKSRELRLDISHLQALGGECEGEAVLRSWSSCNETCSNRGSEKSRCRTYRCDTRFDDCAMRHVAFVHI